MDVMLLIFMNIHLRLVYWVLWIGVDMLEIFYQLTKKKIMDQIIINFFPNCLYRINKITIT